MKRGVCQNANFDALPLRCVRMGKMPEAEEEDKGILFL